LPERVFSLINQKFVSDSGRGRGVRSASVKFVQIQFLLITSIQAVQI